MLQRMSVADDTKTQVLWQRFGRIGCMDCSFHFQWRGWHYFVNDEMHERDYWPVRSPTVRKNEQKSNIAFEAAKHRKQQTGSNRQKKEGSRAAGDKWRSRRHLIWPRNRLIAVSLKNSTFSRNNIIKFVFFFQTRFFQNAIFKIGVHDISSFRAPIFMFHGSFCW